MEKVTEHFYEEKQQKQIDKAAEAIRECLEKDNKWFVAGSGHASIVVTEVFIRAGAHMLIHPIYVPGLGLSQRKPGLVTRLERIPGIAEQIIEEYEVKKGDVLVIFSPPARNTVQVGLGIEAKKRGATLIVICSSKWSAAVDSRHPSGKKLNEVADIVIDDGTPIGDAVLSFAGLDYKAVPISTIAGVISINLLQAKVIEKLLENGQECPVYVSANLDEGNELNRKTLAKVRHKIDYL